MTLFLSFFLYSFAGFLLEVAYACFTHSHKPDRKCFLFLPLCPVYGLGALTIVWLAPLADLRPLPVALLGGAAATAVEYLTALFYEVVLKVSFWDYSDLPGHIHGRVCLPFSLLWAGLSLVLVYGVHPAVSAFVARVPVPLSAVLMALTALDGLVSALLLRISGTTDSLKWYE